MEPDAPPAGMRIVVWSWVTTALFVAVTVPYAVGVDAFKDVAAGLDFALFVVSLPVWIYAFGKAVVRTTQGDDVTVPSLFFLSGSTPRPVRRHLFGSLLVALAVAIATVKVIPFSFLEPMLPLGLAGLWAARHGTYPPRRVPPGAAAARAAGRSGRPSP